MDGNERVSQTDDNNTNGTNNVNMIKYMDLGAGYDPEDKRVAKAVEIYQETMEPYIKTNKAFEKSNISTISGYGTNIGPRGQKRKCFVYS